MTAIQAITGNSEEGGVGISQNGYKLRTLCGGCNSKVGREYDPVIGDLCSDITAYLQSPLMLPVEARFDTIPNRLLRGIFSHMLASKLRPNHNVVSEHIRAFLSSPAGRLDPSLHLNYWLYPYPEIAVTNDFGLLLYDGGTREYGLYSVMKFPPLALLLTNVPRFPQIPDLCEFARFGLDDPGRIVLRFDRITAQGWPERDGMVLGGETLRESVWAAPKKRRV